MHDTGTACAGRRNDHLHVTVRRASGSTYDVDVPSTSSVYVGMAWPP